MATESLPLRDIHLPLPIGLWPPAPGWWFLIATLVLVSVLTLFLIHRHRRPTALKQALARVEKLLGSSQTSQVPRNQEISLIIKRLAVTTYPREDVAGLSGQAWIAWIRLQLEDGVLSAQLLEFLKLGPYSTKEDVIKDPDSFRSEIQKLLISIGSPKESLISVWIKRLRFSRFKKT